MTKENFIDIVKPYTMTSIERISALYDSLEYIRKNEIIGDFVECGVWQGGNVLGIAEYLIFHNMLENNIWLYDTFEGMTEPENIDIDLNNISASNILESVKCYASLDVVKKNMSLTKYPKEKIKYVVGDICETLMGNLPKEISLLRLDTDWYKSTKIEIELLYPLLKKDGVLIVDDYGHWKGSKIAIDEYFKSNNIIFDFEYIDYTGIKFIKNI